MGLGDFITMLGNWAQSIILTLGYPGLAFIMFLENVFPPIPSELILPLAGFMSSPANGAKFSLLWVTVVGCLGSLAGAWTFYGLGYLLGEKRTRTIFQKVGKYALLKEEDFDKSLAWFNRYHKPAIFFGRIVPIVRSLISIPAGIARTNALIFTGFTALGTALWSFLLALAGRLLGDHWTVVADFINKYQLIIEILLVALILWFIIARVIKALRKRRQKIVAQQDQEKANNNKRDGETRTPALGTEQKKSSKDRRQKPEKK
jgi:membrane protein DedA with SNARE-associated domain